MPKLVMPKFVMPSEFDKLEPGSVTLSRVPFDDPLNPDLYPGVDALQVGRPEEEIPLCTPHPLVVTKLGQRALHIARPGGERFSLAYTGDTDYREEVLSEPVTALEIELGTGWNRPLMPHQQAADITLAQKLSVFAFSAQQKQNNSQR